jgi:hypothetical protein
MCRGNELEIAISGKHALMHRLGMALSGLCLAHCLLLPILLAATPLALLTWLPNGLAGGLADSEWFHAALIAPVVLVSGPALMRGGGFRMGVLILSVAALVAALFVASEALEIGLTVAGALSLLAAHWLTLRSQLGDGQP